jgi:hypothetical protein
MIARWPFFLHFVQVSAFAGQFCLCSLVVFLLPQRLHGFLALPAFAFVNGCVDCGC